eukprot:SAG11_NODE_24907_length_366_cov_0.966292_2_plen_53_part_00
MTTAVVAKQRHLQHPCYDMAKGDRLLKDIYEALRSGPKWEKTMLVVVYDGNT